MKTNIKLAWRNLWRNRRRTLIAISSIIFSVLLASWMRSMQEGSYDSMIENVVKFYSGYLQVQDTAYWEERTLENSMEVSPELIHQIENLKDVTLVSHRLESFALAANHQHSKPGMVLGIEPEAENRITAISKKIKTGEFLQPGDKSVVLGKGLADFLNLSVGDTLVIIGQGYHGISANGLFPVKGIMEHPNQEFDKRLVLLDIETAREFYSAYGLSTSLVVMTSDHYQVNHLKNAIGNLLSSQKTVLTWVEMQPEIEQLIQSDRASGIIMLGILYLVIAFGMFSVIMMMVKERRREFGVIHAVGMKKRKMAIVVLLETLFIGIIGCTIGLAVSYLFCLWFYHNPIPLTGEMATATVQYGMEPYMFFSIQPSLFYNQMILIFFISLFIAIFPVYNIYRLKITSALRA
ncbi:ABC-type transport system, involved in lipoprotein release, permease component [Tangfeifania diversioriginum]|uniref:ABC-type transport system, involved in lipoprotein release, permease component n=1 Tax=Tangfeifania diversioriginum TaxID=1168035 RepID=A0A1M6P8W8_9BACT|nr:FtsX-like permease family protein [Tangfeifania diversioriginum]SHK04366.1 ABC-type transport system, involved in lipoprotein release, permease component [Tangfeifania diversioriginum]